VQRRTFLTSSLAAAALGAGASAVSNVAEARSLNAAPEGKSRLFYELRRYTLSNGPQRKLCPDFFSGALVPALNRWGCST
jgi:hypothetical protein